MQNSGRHKNKKVKAVMKLPKDTEKIPVQTGVSQGDTISPKLCMVCLEEFLKRLTGVIRKSNKDSNTYMSFDLRITSYF